MSAERQSQKFTDPLNSFAEECHRRSREAGWWNLPGGLQAQIEMRKQSPRPDGYIGDDALIGRLLEVIDRYFIAIKLCLIHSEISEAFEGWRKNLMDDHLPSRKMFDVELADAAIRIGDLAAACHSDLGGATDEKMEYNLHRRDHKIEARNAANGKAF